MNTTILLTNLSAVEAKMVVDALGKLDLQLMKTKRIDIITKNK